MKSCARGIFNGMHRLWLTLACVCCLVGCTGYQMGGKWVGGLPLAGADKCRIQFYSSGLFDFVCGAPESWVGQGDYRVHGDVLEMKYRWISENGKMTSNLPSPMRLRLKGELNHVDATLSNGEKLSWDRKL